MFFSSSNIQKLQLPRYILSIFQLPENDPDHFTCILDNSEVVEFTTNIISRCKLERPSQDILIENNHISKTETASIVYYKGEYLTIGYEDGLVLVFRTSKVEKSSTDIDPDNVKSYINIFFMTYLFIGHTRKVISILQYDNLLFTTGEDCLMKVWNLDVIIY